MKTKRNHQATLSDAKVAERYDISRESVWRRCKNGMLPMPARWYGGVAEWRPDQLDAFDRARRCKPFAVDRHALAGHQHHQDQIACRL